jgi:hypothetical protein
MKKYRVYNERGFVETTDVDFAKQLNNGTMTGVDVIDFELPVQSPNIDKRAMYEAECDHITAEITRRKLIDDLSNDEEEELVILLKQLSQKIKSL